MKQKQEIIKKSNAQMHEMSQAKTKTHNKVWMGRGDLRRERKEREKAGKK